MEAGRGNEVIANALAAESDRTNQTREPAARAWTAGVAVARVGATNMGAKWAAAPSRSDR